MKTTTCRAVRPFSIALMLGLTALSLHAQAPLTIDNITDRSTVSLQTWFRVPSAGGYLYQVQLDGQPMPVDVTNWVTSVDYHEVSVARTNIATGAVSNRLVRFIINSERGAPEKGLIRWTPYPPIPSTASEISGARMKVITPQDYPADLPIPVIVWLENEDGNARRANGYVNAPGFEANPIQIFRGAGSGMLPPAGAAGPINYNATLPGLQTNKVIQIDNATTWTAKSGVLAASEVWPANSRVFLNASLTVPAGLTLTVGAGTIIKLNPLVNITNKGRVTINGTEEQPVVFTATNIVWPERNSGAWGGFLLHGPSAILEATGAILAGGGGQRDFFPFPEPRVVESHRSEQPVLMLHTNAQARLTNCAIIHTAGQVGNGYNSDLTLDHTLFQRAITSGEYVGGTITINHSALIEFPNDDGVVDSDIADADYDGIYFTTGTHILMNSLLGFAKDDVIDSGSGGAGTVLVTNCWVESGLHEAHAWSGGGRVASSFDTVLINSGQGIESGWTEGSADNSPDCFADRLFTTGNSVGARFGDNYDWTYYGRLKLTNSLILHNYRDIFLKTWNSPGSGWQSNSWVDRLQQTDLRSNFLTAADARFPANQAWNPASDGWRIAHWMSTPPEAPVGVGFAYRTNQFPMTNLLAGVPVRLSSFTTNFVTVDYAFENGSGTLFTGSLTFAPGETLQHITPDGFNAQQQSLVRAVLRSANGGELTGRTNIAFIGSVPAAQIGLAVATNFLEGTHLLEGTFVRLSLPVTAPVSLGYTFSAGGQTLQSGTLVLDPLETLKQLFLTAVNPSIYPLIQLTVGNPTNATLAGFSSIAFTNPPLTMYLAVAGNQLPLTAFSNGVPVGLTGGAPLGTRVDFRIEGNRGSFTNGTLTFAQGDLSKLLFAPTLYASGDDFLRVSFSNPVVVPWAGPDSIYYVRIVAAPPGNPQTLIARGSSTVWRYRDLASDPGAIWKTNTFDDSHWPAGPAQLGFSNGEELDEATLIANNSQITSYFRRNFVVSDPAAFTNLSMWLLRDDGGVAYLNGREIFRSPNLPAAPATISYGTTTASPNGENTIDTATVAASFLRAGTNLAAVEIHQQSSTSSDVSFDFELIGNPAPAQAPPQTLYWGQLTAGMTLAWGNPTFVLEQSTNMAVGSWALATNQSPFVVVPADAQRFFRLRQ